jgi:hypothetical protein
MSPFCNVPSRAHGVILRLSQTSCFGRKRSNVRSKNVGRSYATRPSINRNWLSGSLNISEKATVLSARVPNNISQVDKCLSSHTALRQVEVEEALAFGQRSWNLPTLRLTLTLQQE